MISWLISVAAPWLWPLAGLAAAVLWVYGIVAPGKIAAATVNAASLGLAGLAVFLAVWSTADAACEARVEAATRAEEARQQKIVGDALTEARAAGTAAMADAAAARAALEAAIAAADAVPTDPTEPACGLSKRWLKALPE